MQAFGVVIKRLVMNTAQLPSLVAALFLLGCAANPVRSEALSSSIVRHRMVQTARAGVAVDYLNLRTKPDMGARILRVLKRDEVVEVLGRSGDWVRVRTEQRANGWVYGIYLRGIQDDPGRRDISTRSRRGRSSPTVVKGAAKTPQKPVDVAAEPKIKKQEQPQPDPARNRDEKTAREKAKDEGAAQIEGTDAGQQLPGQRRMISGPITDQTITDEGPGTVPSGDVLTTNKQPLPRPDSTPTASPVGSSLIELKARRYQKAVSVRAAPNFTAPIIAWMEPNAHLESLGRDGQWYKVRTDRGIGFVEEEFVQELAR